MAVLLTISCVVGLVIQGVSGWEYSGTSDFDNRYYPKDADFIGCFSQRCLTFKYHVNISIPMTPDACTSGCRDNRFQVAAVYNFSKCSCACEQTCSAQHRQDHSCGLPCRGSPQGVYCGGFIAADVYQVNLQNEPNSKCDRYTPTKPEKDVINYIGCFPQSCMEFDYNINMTDYDISPASCTKACRERGFSVAALYNRTRCSCSCVHSCAKSVLPNKRCGIGLPCVGEVTQLCGGYTSASVYSVKTLNRSNAICTKPNNSNDSGRRMSAIAISLTIVIIIVIAVVIFTCRIRNKEIKWPFTMVQLGRGSRSSSLKVRYKISSKKGHHCDIQRDTASRRSLLSTTVSTQRRFSGLTAPSRANEAPQDACGGTRCANKSSEPWTSTSQDQTKHDPSVDYQYPDHEIHTGSTRSDLKDSRSIDGYDYVSVQIKNTHLQSSETSARSQVEEKMTSVSVPRFATMDHSVEIHNTFLAKDIQEDNNKMNLECGQSEEVGRRASAQESHADSTTKVSFDYPQNSGGRFIPEQHYNETYTISNVNHDEEGTVLNDDQHPIDSLYPQPHHGETLNASNENLDRPDATDGFAKYQDVEDTDSSHLDESYENVTIHGMDDTKLKCGKGEDNQVDPHTYDVRMKLSGFQETGYQSKGMTPCQNPQKFKAPPILPKPSRRKNVEVIEALNERQKSSYSRNAEDVYAEAHYGQTSQASIIKLAKSKPLILQKPKGKHTSKNSITSETPQNSSARDFYAETQ